jgi:hypothetical protein
VLKLRTTPPPAIAKVTFVLGFAMVAFAVIVMVSSLRRWPPKEGDMAASALFAFWGVVIGETSRRSLAYGRTHLRIDRVRGTLTYVEDRLERETIALVDLGELTVVDHDLRAANLNRVLFTSPLLLDVQQRRVQLERIVGEDGAGELLAALGHRVERVSLPGRTNEGRPLAKVPEDLRAEIAARVATLAEEARAYA